MKLDEKLVEVIEQAQKLGNDAFLFGKEQIPEVVEQLLRWKFADACIWLVLGFALMISTVMAVKKVTTILKTKDYFSVEVSVNLLCIWAAVSFIIGGALFFTNLPTAVQIYIAPKVYLIEYAARLMGKS